jgi:hypothetical protein
LVLPADQAAALVIIAIQQAVGQGQPDKGLLAVPILGGIHIHAAAAAVHQQLVQMLLGLHLAPEVQALRHQSPDRL